LREAHLAAALHVSQASIREALLVLESEGLVIKLPNRGTYVTEVSVEQILEANQFRTCLETRAVILAHKHMQPGDEQRLRDILQAMSRAACSGSMYELTLVDLEFHSTMWKMANNLPLERALRGLAYPVLAFAFKHLDELSSYSEEQRNQNVQQAIRNHERVLDAMVVGDENSIAQAISDLVSTTRQWHQYIAEHEKPVG
jgi:DNA-binding GntR family transcriptional regulator